MLPHETLDTLEPILAVVEKYKDLLDANDGPVFSRVTTAGRLELELLTNGGPRRGGDLHRISVETDGDTLLATDRCRGLGTLRPGPTGPEAADAARRLFAVARERLNGNAGRKLFKILRERGKVSA